MTEDVIILGMLDDIKTILERAMITDPIYIGHLPASPDTCLALFEYAGQPPSTLVPFEAPGLQVKIRQATGTQDYQKARTLANTVYNILHDRRNFQEGNNRYTHITAQQSPTPLPRDPQRRLTFVINFIVKKERRT